jgi:hypothetical protein
MNQFEIYIRQIEERENELKKQLTESLSQKDKSE